MSGQYALASERLYDDNIRSYFPQGQDTRLFSSDVPVLLPNIQYEGKDFEDAVRNNSPKYRDDQGVLRRYKVENVVGQTYRFAKDSTQASHGIPKLAVRSGKPARQAAALSLTAPDVNLNVSGHKYQNINDHGKQPHHLISVSLHGGALEGRSIESQAYITSELAKEGFYLGDDRRNYVGLYGNVIHDPIAGEVNFAGINEHQAGVHSKNTIVNQINQTLLPSREQFHQMTDDEVINVLKLSGHAARADLQDVKGIGGKARAKTEKLLQKHLAKVIAQMRAGQLPM